MNLRMLAAFAAPLALVALLTAAQDAKPAAAPVAKSADAEVIAYQKACYPLTTCPISHEALGKDSVDTLIDGRLVRTCCANCVAGAEKGKADIFKAIDAAVITQQKAAYPLEKCPISGEALPKDAVDFVWGTRLVRFCCNDCVGAFKKDPSATLKKLDDAYIAAQKPNYPLDTCVISGEKIGADPKMETVDLLYGTHYFKLCCGGCVKAVKKDPAAAWAKVEAARAAKAGEKKG